MKNFENKSILITGCCGTIGSELLNQLAQMPVKELIGIDNNESELFFIDQKFKSAGIARFILCDIKDKDQLRRIFKGVHIVIHAAARKHVIINEVAPSEAIQTNIIGTQNVIEAAQECDVERVIFTSSDKAVNPTNVMGTSKLMGERLMTAANASTRGLYPIFSSTRFGNVLGSNGSVIPIFKRQILNKENITLTAEEMSRFVMTVDDASRFVLQSVGMAKGGEVFVTKMPVIRIIDLAHAMIEIYKERSLGYDTEIEIIGAKPGEKMYEELINEEEVRRTYEIGDLFSVVPAFQGSFGDINYLYTPDQRKVDKVYRSDQEPAQSLEELKKYLKAKNLV